MQEKILEAKSTYRLLKQMRLLKNMLGGIIKMIPGMNKLSDDQLKQGETQLKRSEAMINSMTSEERRVTDLLASSPGRRRRIAALVIGTDVAKLVSDLKMRALMQQMGHALSGMPGMFGGMGSPQHLEILLRNWLARLKWRSQQRRREKKKKAWDPLKVSASLKPESETCVKVEIIYPLSQKTENQSQYD